MDFSVLLFWGVTIVGLYLFAKKMDQANNEKDSVDKYTENDDDCADCN